LNLVAMFMKGIFKMDSSTVTESISSLRLNLFMRATLISIT
jgi:hypothetical protein